jgi:S-adenosyl-L-methionine hydrolase (adenosine-forming)
VIVTLLTDYGRDDDFVGVCHGVIRGIHPDVQIVDITHGVERYAVRQGALVLRNTLPYMPPGVHVAVIDPQVGTERRALALRTVDGRLLVGPDNGVLSLAWERCGGIDLAVDITRSPHRLQTVGLPEPRVEDGTLLGHALVVDRFGNVALDVDHGDMAGTQITLGSTVEIEVSGELYLATYAQTFADVRPGELIVYEDAYRTLAVAINRGDAAATLGLRPDAELRLRPR